MSNNGNSNGNSADLEIFQGGFTKVPTFFVDQLIPIAAGVSAMFWKFLLVVWRDLCDPHRGSRCVKTMTQFPGIGKTAAMKWTAALWASCLFDVDYGKRHVSSLPGTPTVIRYRPKCTQQEWVCFIEALRDTIHLAKENNEDVNEIEPFKIRLTFYLRTKRREAGLPTNECQKRIDAWVKNGTIKVDENHNCDWMRTTTDRTRVLDAETKAYYQN